MKQIIDGYEKRDSRDTPFPRSLVFVGARHIGEYFIQARGSASGGPNPFAIIKNSLTVDDFTLEEIRALYSQHAAVTGPVFEPSAFERVWRWTEGQPWLVNLIGKEAITSRLGNDYSKNVTGEIIDLAARDPLHGESPALFPFKAKINNILIEFALKAAIVGIDDPPDATYAQYALGREFGREDPASGSLNHPLNPFYREIVIGNYANSERKRIAQYAKTKRLGKNPDLRVAIPDFIGLWRKDRLIVSLGYYRGNDHSAAAEGLAKTFFNSRSAT
jgi:hypothetical protein